MDLLLIQNFIMLKNISNLGKPLNKNEQLSINGGKMICNESACANSRGAFNACRTSNPSSIGASCYIYKIGVAVHCC
ncbi:hypothetical protein SAMN04489761_0847 [Tenacibaculum sp. MAR_2009_124]|uniref:hypothetical protein n=1 Tax=Tenacibaculum sp. MAR_2009_124 TaxID=1250059 RepID=UPI000896A7E9|nr:hypothetical protein [Tenacibaculum sp. MAR_2009_124]SEB45995.1 hypothetical protein SAMN04489761_0847 [Tenacibaculum sp. MAR_2009_124]